MKKLSGFTLIELLIVVAIIAILAAIAVPNFLEAQTRAKVSRVKSDLRTLGTGLEMYRVDHNSAPNDYNTNYDPDPHPNVSSASGILHPGYRMSNGTIKIGLTTPVSYLTDCWLRDPFVGKTEAFTSVAFDEQVYSYNPMVKIFGRNPNSQYVTNNYKEYYGTYRLGSIGPDRDWYNNSTFGSRRHTMIYDATNGTVSIGNIWRSEKDPECKDRPLADRTLP